jgi:hypothetical protein
MTTIKMNRSIFLLLTAVIALFFGGMMLVAPDKASETFGLAFSPEIGIVFRWLGVMIVCSGILNFIVRKDNATSTLKAVLIFTAAFHALSLFIDFVGIGQGILKIGNLIPGIVVHSFVAVGSVFYLLKIKTSES